MLRKHFPKTPMLALTATATGRVREDIIQMLRLQDVRCYVASFNRPNLRYNVVRREEAMGNYWRSFRHAKEIRGLSIVRAVRPPKALQRNCRTMGSSLSPTMRD